MAGREWPLVLFTLLSQFAVGAYLLITLPLFMVRSAKPEGDSRDPRLGLVLITLGLLSAAGLASFFHLGNLKSATQALNNLNQSWLSREILFELTTLFVLSVLALLILLKTRNTIVVQGTALLAGASGLFFLACMAKIYMLPTVPAWNTFFTPCSFLLTAFLLGAAAGTAVGASGALKHIPFFDRAMPGLALALALLAVATALLAAPHFGVWGSKAAASLKYPADPSLPLFIGRIILLLSGAVLLILTLKKKVSPLSLDSSPAVLTAFFCFLAAEAMGRFLFYALALNRR